MRFQIPSTKQKARHSWLNMHIIPPLGEEVEMGRFRELAAWPALLEQWIISMSDSALKNKLNSYREKYLHSFLEFRYSYIIIHSYTYTCMYPTDLYHPQTSKYVYNLRHVTNFNVRIGVKYFLLTSFAQLLTSSITRY